MQSLLRQQCIICIHVIVAIYSIMGPYPYPGDLTSINRSDWKGKVCIKAMAHTVGTYPIFCKMSDLGVFLLNSP